MTKRLTYAIGAMLLMASGGGAGEAFGQSPAPTGATATTYRLASAQVVTSTVRPPALKLTASGPIAFQILPIDANGDPAGPVRVVARLFGVAPGDLASFGDLAPFALTVTAAASGGATDVDTIVTITTGAVSPTSGQMLVLRAGMKSNELEAAIVPVP
jgi:hypothetical protein